MSQFLIKAILYIGNLDFIIFGINFNSLSLVCILIKRSKAYISSRILKQKIPPSSAIHPSFLK